MKHAACCVLMQLTGTSVSIAGTDVSNADPPRRVCRTKGGARARLLCSRNTAQLRLRFTRNTTSFLSLLCVHLLSQVSDTGLSTVLDPGAKGSGPKP
jgi:hypothetical protein